LVLRTEQLLDSLPKFISFLNQTRVSVISLPTAFWHHLTESIADLTLPDSLRLVIIGGERALPDRLTQWQAYVPNAIQLINSYGPTEVSVVSTMAFLETAVVPHGAECPIGTPIPNAQVLVLDDHGQPVPIGVAGELYIGGKGVAKGYWQQPEKTSHAFIQLPRKLTRYLQQPSSTFYKTGDLVQWEANGALTFVGRRDNQIKIRGVRIEPSEIELCLRAHTAVSDAIVQPYTQANGETQLIAYLILQTPIADSLLKAHIGETMLAQMVPSQFCKLDAWPLLPNGKVDVASLPKPNLAPVSETVEFAAPQTATEKTLCTIWASCLNIPTIGITTNFFDVGGHSLLAMKLVTQIETQLNHPLSVRQLFEYPTIHQLGQVIDSLNAISKVAQTVQSEQQPTNAELLFEEGEL
ncbi:MAG: non-ribosomal peptide synthetase, partial [Chloroflexota bacterium]